MVSFVEDSAKRKRPPDIPANPNKYSTGAVGRSLFPIGGATVAVKDDVLYKGRYALPCDGICGLSQLAYVL